MDGKGKGIEKGKGKCTLGHCWCCVKKGHRQTECRTHPNVAPVEEAVDEDHSWEDEEFHDGWGVQSLLPEIKHVPKAPPGLVLSKRWDAFKDDEHGCDNEPNTTYLK